MSFVGNEKTKMYYRPICPLQRKHKRIIQSWTDRGTDCCAEGNGNINLSASERNPEMRRRKCASEKGGETMEQNNREKG